MLSQIAANVDTYHVTGTSEMFQDGLGEFGVRDGRDDVEDANDPTAEQGMTRPAELAHRGLGIDDSKVVDGEVPRVDSGSGLRILELLERRRDLDQHVPAYRGHLAWCKVDLAKAKNAMAKASDPVGETSGLGDLDAVAKPVLGDEVLARHRTVLVIEQLYARFASVCQP